MFVVKTEPDGRREVSYTEHVEYLKNGIPLEHGTSRLITVLNLEHGTSRMFTILNMARVVWSWPGIWYESHVNELASDEFVVGTVGCINL